MRSGEARRMLAGFLVSYHDDALGKFWPLWVGKNSVGRAETGLELDIEIAHGTTSSRHAAIECDHQRFILADLGSTNGTFHNEEAIGLKERRELRDGDKIRFGSYSVMLVNVLVPPTLVPPTEPSPPTRRSAPGCGRITARALEPETTIEIEGLDTPHARFKDRAKLQEEVPIGAYRVTFRLGGDVFYKTEVDVDDDETEIVTPQALASPLAREVFASDRGGQTSVVLADGMGPIQAGVVPTLLATLGIKLFAVRHRLGDFDRYIVPRDPAALGGRPVALVVAADGEGWAKPVPEVLAALRFRLTSWGTAPGPWTPFEPLSAVPDPGSGRGLARIGKAGADVPPGPFLVELWSGMMPLLRLPSVALTDRAAVITLTMQPDGVIDVFQYLPLLPDDVDVGSLHMPYANMLRRAVVGQLLHRRGELSAMGLRQGFRHDPLLRVMDLLAGFAAGEHFTSLRESTEMLDSLLPDNVVIQALIAPERDTLIAQCLDAGLVPLLAESTRVLAGEAPRLGRPSAPVVEWARRIPEGSLWALNLE